MGTRSANSVYSFSFHVPIFALKTKIMVYWTLDYFQLLYKEYTTCGVSVRDFCRERGIQENRFYYWIKKLKSQTVSALEAPREFIPISPAAVNCLTRTSSIESTKEETSLFKVHDLKITYPNGVILQMDSGCDLEILKQLITLTP